MFSKFMVPLCLVLAGVQAQRRQFPVPSRLIYGPTVPIAKAAQEIALGYAASMPNGILTNAPTGYGNRVSKLQHSPNVPISGNSFSHGAYPASLAVSKVATPLVAAPASPEYRPAYAAPIAAAPAIAAPTFAAHIAPQYYAAPKQEFAPQAYSFGYQSVDEHGNRQSRQEESDANNFKKGSYSFTDVYGISRRVDYVADHGGFRATINTNEPGTAPSAPAAVLYSKSVVHRKA